ncbi:hypothetical protein [Roseibium suaedae]|uniref:Uncharacterized protein n=1 Tax=Roseibium suaedae TaxID=735517 RepID=A0A1M7MLX7_9HYPH|nr:hypothetical protein [Roseibium suaedae]SHM91943.1 hypothetical protein SAMN05444272_3465 [Roseibium suaedae]
MSFTAPVDRQAYFRLGVLFALAEALSLLVTIYLILTLEGADPFKPGRSREAFVFTELTFLAALAIFRVTLAWRRVAFARRSHWHTAVFSLFALMKPPVLAVLLLLWTPDTLPVGLVALQLNAALVWFWLYCLKPREGAEAV